MSERDKRWRQARAEQQREVNRRSGAPVKVWLALAAGALILWLVLAFA